MTGAIPRSSLLTYDEAAALLGIQRASAKQLVARGRLHSIAAPEDRRRRLLVRAEVEAYARDHAGKWSYEEGALPLSVVSAAPQLPPLSQELVLAGTAGVVSAELFIKAFHIESDMALKLLILGVVIAIALVLLREWLRQGKLNAAQARHLEKLAQQAETNPDAFLQEFERLLPTG
jgi:excisionase family DNA binding protein